MPREVNNFRRKKLGITVRICNLNPVDLNQTIAEYESMENIIDDKVLVLVGQRIKNFRVNLLQVSQEEFAFRVDMHRSYISDVERGMRNISLLNLIKMANVLGVEVAELLPKWEEIST